MNADRDDMRRLVDCIKNGMPFAVINDPADTILDNRWRHNAA